MEQDEEVRHRSGLDRLVYSAVSLFGGFITAQLGFCIDKTLFWRRAVERFVLQQDLAAGVAAAAGPAAASPRPSSSPAAAASVGAGPSSSSSVPFLARALNLPARAPPASGGEEYARP